MTEFGPQATRERLLAAAAQAIAEHGYASTTLSRVAASLGLTKGAYAYHFPTKAKIADALRDSFYELIRECHGGAHRIFPAGDMYTFISFLALMGHRVALDPIASGAVTVTFDLSTPRQHAAAMIQDMQDSIVPLIETARETEQISSERSVEFQASSAMAMLLGSHFIGSRYSREEGEPRLRAFRAMLEMLGAPAADEIVDAVLHRMMSDPRIGQPPTYRAGILTYPEQATEDEAQQ